MISQSCLPTPLDVVPRRGNIACTIKPTTVYVNDQKFFLVIILLNVQTCSLVLSKLFVLISKHHNVMVPKIQDFLLCFNLLMCCNEKLFSH